MAKESKVEIEKEGVRERERERGKERRDFEGSEEISRNFLQVLRATRENSRKVLRGDISSRWRTGVQAEERKFLEAAPTCDFLAIVEVDARQLRAISQHLDVACVE